MGQKIRDVMTADPTRCPPTATMFDAAKMMKDRDVGNVLVQDGDKVVGIVTDRDLVVRGMAAGRDPKATKVSDVCSGELTTVAPDESVDNAVRIMREQAVRRLPVVENGKPVGIVSIGDLAMERDPGSALADISAAPANT